MTIKSIKDKLKNSRGESLAEVLITILLVGIVSSGFLVVVETANGMSKRAQEVDKNFFEDISEVESGLDGAASESGTVTIKIDGGTPVSEINVTVDKIVGTRSGITSYRLKKADRPNPDEGLNPDPGSGPD